MTKEIPLTQGYVAIVDDCDYERIAAFKWSVGVHKRKDGSLDCRAKRQIRTPAGKLTSIYLHREVLQCGPRQIVDHADRNPLNNTRANLRLATHSQNAVNKVTPPPKSGYRGVHLNKSKFQVCISSGNRNLRLGSYATPEEAARVYDAAAKRMFGPFAVLNFPDQDGGVHGQPGAAQ